jgi:hypothetical protein
MEDQMNDAPRQTLMGAGLAAPLVVLLILVVIRLAAADRGFGPVALTAAGLYVVLAAPVSAWLCARGILKTGLPGYAFVLLAGFGVSMLVPGLGLATGPAALVVAGLGPACMIGVALAAVRGTARPGHRS